MNKLNFIDNATRLVNKGGFKLRKCSPEILVIGGVLGVVASAVMACKATTKLDEVMEESKEKIEQIHNYVDENGYTERYSADDEKKDLAIVYTQSALKVAKLYAPSVGLGVISIASILGGHNILRKRNIALAAAYKALDKSFKDYRFRLVDRFGKDLDRELLFNTKVKEFETKTVDEDGNEKVEKEMVEVISDEVYSPYAKFFDSGCLGWEKDPELNLMFLRRQEEEANRLLKKRGYMFLNDIYEMLGIPKTKAGQIVGWIYDPENPIGDNKIDFGIYDMNKEKSRDFVNGYERTILLDFNVDGDILNRF